MSTEAWTWIPACWEEVGTEFVKVRASSPTAMKRGGRTYARWEMRVGVVFAVLMLLTYPGALVAARTEPTVPGWVVLIGLVLWPLIWFWLPFVFYSAIAGGLFVSRSGFRPVGMFRWYGFGFTRRAIPWTEVERFRLSTRPSYGGIQNVEMALQAGTAIKVNARLFASNRADAGWGFGGAKDAAVCEQLVRHLNRLLDDAKRHQ